MAANPFTASGKFAGSRVHLAIGGSIACYKAAELLRQFVKAKIHVSTTLTEGACKFVTPLLFASLGAMPVYSRMFTENTDIFAHLEPGQLGGVYLAVPATADMLARFAQGQASDMASCQALAFEGPKIAAPAMNTRMWRNAATQDNVERLRKFGWHVVPPEKGELACGETGAGRLAALPEIFLASLYALAPKDMAGLNVLVTLGPTREIWDGVRYWSNPSSGKMGAALATAAWLRGANVTAVCGPGFGIDMPEKIKLVHVNTAREMFEAAQSLWPAMDMGIFCAAVADFRPAPVSDKPLKVKKAEMGEEFEIKFLRNPDILSELAKQKTSSQRIMGFAAEIIPDEDSLIPLAKLKLRNKKADIIAANRVGGKVNAFASQNSALTIADCKGRVSEWPFQPKADAAWELCSWLLTL